MVSTTVIHSGSERVLTSCDYTELCVSWPQAPINGCRNVCCVNCFSSAFAQRQYGMLFIWPVIVLFEEKAMVPHSSTLAWKIPWTEEPGRLQSMGLLRVGHDWATSLSLSCIGEGNGNPLYYSCLENPRDRGAWWAAIYGVAQSWTRLKRLSSSSSSSFWTL